MLISYCQAGSKSKPHPHQGHLQPYDGKHIAYNITQEQNQKLNSGQPVSRNSNLKLIKNVFILKYDNF